MSVFLIAIYQKNKQNEKDLGAFKIKEIQKRNKGDRNYAKNKGRSFNFKYAKS